MPRNTCWIAIWFGSLCTGHVADATSLAQDDGVGAAATAPVEEDLPNLSEIQKDIEAIRGLQFKHDVPAERQSVEELSEFVDRELDAMFPDGLVAENRQVGLYRLGMLTEPRDLVTDIKHAYTSQIVAYYDPKIKKFFYVMTDMPMHQLKVVASHELVHALQDQHFDLQTRTDEALARDLAGPRNDDLNLVLTSLVEGEATYVMTLWERLLDGVDLTQDRVEETDLFSMMAAFDGRELAAMMEGASVNLDNQTGQAMAALAEIPAYVLDPMYASYMKGAYFVMRLRQQRGWDAITDAYNEMPASSEQILHPKKFTTDRDDPTPLMLPEFSAIPADEWTTLDRAVHGEFYLSILLRNLDCNKVAAERATAGWDGDIYAAYRHADSATIVIVLATTWDTRRDALQFFEAYKSVLPNKYERIEVIIEDDREFVYDAGMPLMGRGRLVRRGREVFIVEGGSADLNASIAAELQEMVIEQVE